MESGQIQNFDVWWYVAAEQQVEIIAKQGSSSTERGSIIDAWIPIPVQDSYRIERGLHEPSFREFPDEIIIHDNSGQRLAKASYSTMTVTPLYWDGPMRPLRRVIWLQMKGEDDIQGGNPVQPEWDSILEAAYQENLAWIQSGTSDQPVEKLISLSEPLSSHVLLLRMGMPNYAKIVPIASLQDRRSVFGKNSTMRLIRGYVPYYIAVASAIKIAESSKQASKSPTDASSIALPSPFEVPLMKPPQAPKSLVFAVHGIGQKFVGRLGNDFIKDCNNLRDRILFAINQREGNIEDILVLPINWRAGLKMGIKPYHPNSEDEVSLEELVSRITLNNIPAIREFCSDVGLDVLLYMTPGYFRRIIESALEQIHRLYSIFLKAAGEGSKDSKVSFVGHSLGSAIVSDLLSFIVSDASPEGIQESATAVLSNLGFAVDRFFALGSPLAMLFLLKQIKPIGCVPNVHKIQLGEYKDLKVSRTAYPSLPGAEEEDNNPLPSNVMFACREVYNIFHPYDPLAYRLEPLVVPPEDMRRFIYPVRLPYNKKGALHLKRQMEESMQDLKERANKAKEEIVNSLPEWLKVRIKSPSSPSLALEDGGNRELIEGPIEERERHTATRSLITTHPAFLKFNHHGRVDFSVEEALFENSYLAAISSHFSYWDDIDIASFLAIEFCSLPLKPL